MSHVAGDRHHGLLEQRRHAGECPGHCGTLLAPDHQALRSHQRRDHPRRDREDSDLRENGAMRLAFSDAVRNDDKGVKVAQAWWFFEGHQASVDVTNGTSLKNLGLPTASGIEEKQGRSEVFVKPLSLS